LRVDVRVALEWAGERSTIGECAGVGRGVAWFPARWKRKLPRCASAL